MRETRMVTVGPAVLAFGLDWLPLLDEHPDRLARQLARHHRATHAVLSGSDQAAVGLAWLRGQRRSPLPYSGAKIFALLNPRGTVATILDMGDGSLCVLATHEGVVLSRSDRIYPDATLAQAVIDELRLAYPRLRGPAIAGQAAMGLEDLARHASEEARLQRTPWQGWVRPGVMGLLGCATALTAWLSLGDARNETPHVDARQAWMQAQRRLLDQHRVHGAVGTRTLLAALYRQPATIAGWHLRQLSCRQADDGSWRCLGEYERVAPQADNRGLLHHAPREWKLEFTSLGVARAAWALSMPAQAPDQSRPPSVDAQDRDWASQTQAVLPAFTAFRLDARRPLEPPAPRDAEGQALPRPADMRRYAMRELRIDGPLRSAVLLIPISRHIGWRKAALTLSHRSGAGLSDSAINLHLEGVLYETQDPPVSAG